MSTILQNTRRRALSVAVAMMWAAVGAWAQRTVTVTETIDFMDRGYVQGDVVTDFVQNDIAVAFTNSGGTPATFSEKTQNTGYPGVNLYKNGDGTVTFSVQKEAEKIKTVTLTFYSRTYSPNGEPWSSDGTGAGTIYAQEIAWTCAGDPDASFVALTCKSSKNFVSLQKAVVTYVRTLADDELIDPIITGESEPDAAANNAIVFAGQTTVTLTADPGTDIFYTLDGTEPTAGSTRYTTPFTLTESSVVKAIATRGEKQSAVAIQTFKNNLLQNIAALHAQVPGSYKLTLDNAVVTYVSGNSAYIEDASGAVLYNSKTHGLLQGQKLNGVADVTYAITTAKNPQITTLSGVTAEGEGTVVEPTTVTAEQWPEDFAKVVSRYVKIDYVLITTGGTTGPKGTVNGVPVTLFPAGTSSMTDLKAGCAYSVIGSPAISNTTNQIRVSVHPEPMIGVTIPASGVASFASKHAINLDGFTEGGAYVVSSIQNNAAQLEPVSGTVPAGTGLIVMGEAGTYAFAAAEGEVKDAPANLLLGITESMAIYGIKDGVFKAILPGTVPAGKAILPAPASLGVKTLSLTLDGTAVTEITAEGDAPRAVIYDLYGRRVERATKGVYIVNGKKTVVR